MRYLVFDTEAAANTAEATIFGYGKALAEAGNYATDADGIIGNRDGVPDPTAARTGSWSKVTQRVNDNKWIVAHPEAHHAAQDPDKLALMMGALAQLGPVVEETADATWWPNDGLT